MPKKLTTTINLENVNHPGSQRTANAAMYEAMKLAMLASLPSAAPGLTIAQLHDRVLPKLSTSLYPGGAKAGWWLKAVQLDLEAKGIIARDRSSPLLLRRT
jgi:hypothetical protein